MPLYNLYGPYNMKPINIYNLVEFRGKRRFCKRVEFLGRFLESKDYFSKFLRLIISFPDKSSFESFPMDNFPWNSPQL